MKIQINENVRKPYIPDELQRSTTSMQKLYLLQRDVVQYHSRHRRSRFEYEKLIFMFHGENYMQRNRYRPLGGTQRTT